MITINNIEDLARILETQPHWATTLRTLLLSDELLTLPEKFARLTATVQELQAQFAQLTATVQELQAIVAQLTEAVKELRQDVDELKAGQSRIENELGYLRGSDLEVRLHRKIRPLVSQRLGLRRASIVQSNLQEPNDDFANQVSQALEQGLINPAQDLRVAETDLILRAQRGNDSTPVWVVVEAANRLDADDINRARETADAMAIIFSAEAIPVVIGYRIDQPDRERAGSAGVQVIPEFRL